MRRSAAPVRSTTDRPGRRQPPVGGRRSGEAGDIVLSWLVKLTVVLSLLGIVAHDGISVMTASFAADDTAQTAAVDATQYWRDSHHDPAGLLAAATSELDPKTYSVDPSQVVANQDGTVTVTVHRTARTLVLYRIGPLAHYAMVSGTASSAPD